ncbi:MAG TPA: LacI family DNA-binding transcriptional regulator, partial [Chloroflexota bacterium]
MTTIKDIASAAGVSVSTVSHALSGNRPISEPTRARVLA